MMMRGVLVGCCVLGLVVGGGSPAVAQDRDSLGTKLTANGDTITLLWDPKHPWDAQLGSGSARLMAEYSTKSQGVVAEQLSRAKSTGAQSHILQFTLPEHIVAQPTGPICLYVQLGDRVLPIRKANGQVGDTTRFRYVGWEKDATHRTEAFSQQQLVGGLRAQLKAAQDQQTKLRQSLQARNVTTAESCNNVTMESFALRDKTPDILPREQHEATARRVCASRVMWGQKEIELEEKDAKTAEDIADAHNTEASMVQPPEVLGQVLAFLEKQSKGKDQNLPLRRQQLNQFASDYKQWSPTAMSYTNPPFGRFPDMLRVQNLTRESVMKVLIFLADSAKAERPSYEDFAGLVGGSLETYSRCVVDGQKQLLNKLTAWNEMQSSAAGQDARAHQQLVEGCKREVGGMARLTEAVAALQLRLDAAEKTTAPNESSVSVYAKPIPLNEASCDARASR